MKTLLLGARGAVGRVIARELIDAGYQVTCAGRTESSDTTIDLYGDLSPLTVIAGEHDVVVNASGVERVELAHACGSTPFVEISATGSYLAQLRDTAAEHSSIVLGAGLVPGLSTILASSLDRSPGDDVDIFVMLGSGVNDTGRQQWTGRRVWSGPTCTDHRRAARSATSPAACV